MRSVYTSPNGQPHYSLGTHLTTHESPFTERFGGWYATGKQGKTRHLANLIVPKREDKLNLEPGANLIDLSRRFQTDRYLTPHSDWIALMVLAHQAEMHNLMTLVNFQTRQAIHQGQAMNKALDRDKEFMSDSTRNRINRAVESLLDYMLFVNEAGFESPMSGTSGFGEYFQSLGPFDKQGRSLRQFDLKSRTFKYRCSYLIYSGSFRQLPQVAKDRTLERLWEILTGKDESAKYTVIPAEEKLAIRQILTSTLKDLPKYWR